MYSTLSEKPTRAREGGRRAEEFESSGKKLLSRKDGCEMDLFIEWPNADTSSSIGVTGALPARCGALVSAGLIIADRSWEEMAPERR